MHFKKQGFPNEGEIVICTVKTIQKTTVFVNLDEFEGKEGIIHISEISPGRIRTIRDFVKEGKKVVCKVLRRNLKYGNLDLSLRRVTTGQKLQKLKDLKLEEKSEKIIESAVKQLKLDFDKVYKEISDNIPKYYDSIGMAFQEIAEDHISINDLKINKKLSEALESIIKTRLKPQEIKSSKVLIITCPTDIGIDSIKKSLKIAIDLAEKKKYDLKLDYISAPRYSITLTDSNHKEAEAQSEEIIEVISESIKKDHGSLDVEKQKK